MVTQKNGSTQTKGVNTTSDTFLSLQLTPSTSEQHPSQTSNLSNVKQELQAVIDLMGPTTPNFTFNTSSDADNEESVFTTTRTTTTVNKFSRQETSSINTPREFSEMSAIPESSEQNQPPHHQKPCYCSYPPIPPPICMNPNCVCAVGYLKMANHWHEQNCNVHKEQEDRDERKTSRLYTWFKNRRTSKDPASRDREPVDLYKINITQDRDDQSPPRRLTFELIDGIPKPTQLTKATQALNGKILQNGCTNTNDITQCSQKMSQTKDQGIHSFETDYTNMVVTHNVCNEKGQSEKKIFSKKKHAEKLNDAARVDIYYFDHGNSAYYRTTDAPPLVTTELLAERTEYYATKFWAELFGTIYVGFAFVTTFVLQLLRFILYSIIRPLTVGIIQLISDYFFKPFLAVLFNGVVQPPLIFLYNVFTSLRDLCDPVAEGFGYFIREIAVLFRAIRFIEIRKERKCLHDPPCPSKTCVKGIPNPLKIDCECGRKSSKKCTCK